MLLEKLAALVNAIVARVDYFALRAGKVVSQADDGTCDIRLDDTRFPDLARVPYRSPGTKLKVAPGARVVVAFEDGDPSKPAIVMFDAATVLEMVLGGQDGIGVARQGDMVTMAMPPVLPIVGTVAPPLPSGTSFTGTITITSALSGVILTGSGKVKASS